MRQLYLISYDIADCRVRSRLLRLIKASASSGQKSVYECWLDEHELAELIHVMDAMINPVTDRALMICLDRQAAIHTLGIAPVPGDAKLFYFD